MKARSVLILLLLFPLFVCAKSTLDIQRWQTKNGAQVYFVQAIELPMVDIQIAFTAGSAFDNQLPGLAALTNTMLSDGADQLSADQIAEQFDDVGAIYVNDITIIKQQNLCSYPIREIPIFSMTVSTWA